MKQTKIGNRFIVVGHTPSATEKVRYRKPTNQRATFQRVVVIKNGELVSGKSGRQ
jgi:hypothetical protein